MKVQFIYTFHDREQVITAYNDLWKAFIESKNVFLSYAMAVLDTDEERQNLVKISCCITDAGKIKTPTWYSKIRGKFWVDDLEQWKKENGYKSTVPYSYVEEWKLINA